MNNDVVLLQETWLSTFDLPFLTTLDDDFYCKGISSMTCDERVLTGRPFGGLAILWRKSIGQSCSIVEYDDARLLGIELKYEGNSALIVNVYMPYDCHDNVDEFHYYLNKVNDIIEEYDNPHVFVMGDFNANVSQNNV